MSFAEGTAYNIYLPMTNVIIVICASVYLNIQAHYIHELYIDYMDNDLSLNV